MQPKCGDKPCETLLNELCDPCEHPQPKSECRNVEACLELIDSQVARAFPCATCDLRSKEEIAEDLADAEYHRLTEEMER